MNAPGTSLEAAQSWCLGGWLPQPVLPPDDTLDLVMAESLSAELDAAARQYSRAVDDKAETVYFVVRDRRAPRERIVTALRERGVPINSTTGLAPDDDPVVTELLQVTNVLVTYTADEDISSVTRSTLADRLDTDIDIDSVLTEVMAAPTLVEALDRWIERTSLIDRLLRSVDCLHHQSHPQGTVTQQASAQYLAEIREVARYLDTLHEADLSLTTFGPEALAAAIEESV